MKSTKNYLIIVFAFLILVSSCRNDLSRGKAKELITQKNKLPQVETTKLAKKYLIKSWGDGWKLCGVNGERYSNAKNRLTDLHSKGMISLSESQEHQGGCHYHWVIASLTPEGQKFLIKESYGEFEVKTCEISFGEITGIQQQDQFKEAIAEYTLLKINPTPFCGEIPSDPIKKSANFSLYDDGWRIE